MHPRMPRLLSILLVTPLFVACASSERPVIHPSALASQGQSEPTFECPQGAKYDGKKCVAVGAKTEAPKGWWCNAVQEPGVAASSCSRTREECEAERSAMKERGHDTTECVATDEAACVVFSGGAWSCVATMAECAKATGRMPAGAVERPCEPRS